MKARAGEAGRLSKRAFVRDGSHSGVPQGFDQNGPLPRHEGLKDHGIPAPSLLALGHFASNLEGAINGS
jgi:hypothetical protein